MVIRSAKRIPLVKSKVNSAVLAVNEGFIVKTYSTFILSTQATQKCPGYEILFVYLDAVELYRILEIDPSGV
jgi:hypothetical protein